MDSNKAEYVARACCCGALNPSMPPGWLEWIGHITKNNYYMQHKYIVVICTSKCD
jgi:hypothetical protein